MVNTKGREALVAYLKRDEAPTQTTLALLLGIKQPSVSAWVAGESRPESHLRDALELLTGIPVEAWRTDEERAAVERVKEEVARASSEDLCKTGTEA